MACLKPVNPTMETINMTYGMSRTLEDVEVDYLQKYPLNFKRFSLVHCRYNSEYYILVNVNCCMVHADGVLSYYSFTGIPVFYDEISKDCIKDEKLKDVLLRLYEHGYDNRLTYTTTDYVEGQEPTERDENITELDIELVGTPIIESSWNEMFTATFTGVDKTFLDTFHDCFKKEGLHFDSEKRSVKSFYSKPVFESMVEAILKKPVFEWLVKYVKENGASTTLPTALKVCKKAIEFGWVQEYCIHYGCMSTYRYITTEDKKILNMA